MLDERHAGFGSDADAENFVADQEKLLDKRLELDPLNDEKIDKALDQSRAKEESGS